MCHLSPPEVELRTGSFHRLRPSPRTGLSVGYSSGVRHRAVDHTPVFSPGENAIAKEPGASYPERWPCASLLGASLVAQAPSEPSPNHTLRWGAFSASSLVTPTRRPFPGTCGSRLQQGVGDSSLPPPPHAAFLGAGPPTPPLRSPFLFPEGFAMTASTIRGQPASGPAPSGE